MRDRGPLLPGLVLVALAFVVGSLAIAGGIRDRGRNDTLAVTGSAKAHITSDYAVWDVSVTAQDSDAAPAAKRSDAWAQRLRAFLLAHDIQASELIEYPLATNTVNDDKGNIK